MSVYTTTGVMTNLVQTAYDKMVEFALRSEPVLRGFADKRPVNVDKSGSAVVLQRYANLATATSALTENADLNAVALSNTTTVTITLYEYGNVVLSTEKLRLESLSDVDPAIADILAYNMRDSLDVLVRDVLSGGTNVIYSNAGAVDLTGPTNAMLATDPIGSKMIRYAVAKLRSASAVPHEGGYYVGLVHPDVSHDLRAEVGNASFRPVHEYSGANAIWAGEIGAYEGVRFIETPRTKYANDGSGSATVHRSLILGRQALAEAVAREPGVVIGPVTDKLMRHRPLGWKALIGWARYREEALYRLESGVTI